MTKRLLIAVFAVALMAPPASLTSVVAAQERTPPAPTPPPAPPAPPQPGETPPTAPTPPEPPQPPQPPVVQSMSNVQLDVVITDTISGKPEAKTVTLVLRNGQGGSIRTQGLIWPRESAPAEVELALDGLVSIVGPELVAARVTFTYAAPPQEPDGAATAPEALRPPAKLTENLNTILRSGRPLVVSRSADPVTNRTVTVELTATIHEP